VSSISRRQFLTGRLRGAAAPADPARPRIAVISSACLARNRVVCRNCGELCGPRAIRFTVASGGISAPEVDSRLCTGCGDCVPACPVSAISLVAA
jgi:ferredoxin-type protein NapF